MIHLRQRIHSFRLSAYTQFAVTLIIIRTLVPAWDPLAMPGTRAEERQGVPR
jgi:hypothetical protein